jgi:hypothetical protein
MTVESQGADWRFQLLRPAVRAGCQYTGRKPGAGQTVATCINTAGKLHVSLASYTAQLDVQTFSDNSKRV